MAKQLSTTSTKTAGKGWHGDPAGHAKAGRKGGMKSSGNFRNDPENIFGDTVSVNMLCIPAEAAQSSLAVLHEITGATDQ